MNKREKVSEIIDLISEIILRYISENNEENIVMKQNCCSC